MIRWHRRARKTTLALNKLIMEAAACPKSVQTYIAPTYKQAKSIIWRDPNMIKKYLPVEACPKGFNESELFVELYNGSLIFIKGADDPDSLRGINHNGIVLDEYAMMKPQVWDEILRPVLTENKGWAWFLFTPKGMNHAYKSWQQIDHWNRQSGRNDWSKHSLSADESGLIDKTELMIAKQQMPEKLYQQEFLVEFLEGEGNVFKGISRCINGTLQPAFMGARYIMGVDLAKSVDFTVLIVIDQIAKRVVHFERFQDISWRIQKERIMANAKKYNDAFVYIDSTGVGDPIVEDLEALGLNVEGFKFNATSKRQLIERLIVAIEQRLILFPRIEELVTELEAFSYEISNNGIKYGAPDGFHDDCVIALALAVYGLGANMYSSTQSDVNISFDNIISSNRCGY